MQPHESQGEGPAAKGLEEFRQERYEQAAILFEEALRTDPNNATWRELLDTSRANATA